MRKLRAKLTWPVLGLLLWAAAGYAVSITALGPITVTSIVNTGPYTGSIGSGTPSAGAFTTLSSSVSDSLGTGYLSETRVVTAALTTTAGLLVKTATTGNTVSTAALADVGVAGVAITSQTAGQNVEVAIKGVTLCVADNTTVIGDVVGVGTATAGRCKDLGQTSGLTVSSQLQIVGKALSVATVGNTFSLQVYSQGIYGGGSAAGGTTTATIASGTSALGTGAITSATCATVVTTSATGTATTDNVMADFNADPTAVTGYSPSASGMLTIIKYPTANNVNFKVCNNTGGTITPGAITLNWRVVR